MDRVRATRSSARRVPLPNLAAAGRSTPSEKKSEPSTSGPGRGRGRGRGNQARTRGAGRGRGRGGGRGGARNDIIEGEAVFTAGLAEHDFGKKQRVEFQRDEKIVGKLERSDYTTEITGNDGPSKKIKKEPNGLKTESTRCTYEMEWMSDDEYDQQELDAIIQPGILSDVKKGTELPIVLPSRDTEQFHALIKKRPPSPRRQLKEEPIEVDTVKTEVMSEATTHESMFEKMSNLGLFEAGEFMKEHINKGKTKEFLLLQLPASLRNLKHAITKGEESSQDVEMNTQDAENEPSSSTAGPSNIDDPKKTRQKNRHCLDGIPSNVEIGKLQLLKSGKVRLMIGDRPMEIHPAISSNLHEVLVHVQVNKPDLTAAQNGFTGRPPSPPPSNMNVIGRVTKSLLCSYNYNNLLKKLPP